MEQTGTRRLFDFSSGITLVDYILFPSKQLCSSILSTMPRLVSNAQCTSSLQYAYENKNSLKTGDPENSGFNRMQLHGISNAPRL